MTPYSHKCAWDTPIATILSIRSTANGVGYYPDIFTKGDMVGRPDVAPPAPLADAGTCPIPSGSQTVMSAKQDWRAWSAPVVSTLPI